MKPITRHFTRVFVAGIVALLPLVGLVLTVMYMEVTISESWLADQPYYFPGFGILAALVAIYLIGLIVSTFLGRWVLRLVDQLLHQLPALGQLYRTLKEILGYGVDEDAVFRGVVLLKNEDAQEIGLVTSEYEEDGASKLAVFVPGAPNPTTGRMLFVDRNVVEWLPITVNTALKSMVTIGKTPLVDDDDA